MMASKIIFKKVKLEKQRKKIEFTWDKILLLVLIGAFILFYVFMSVLNKLDIDSVGRAISEQEQEQETESTATIRAVIEVENAEHLDSEKTFISDITNEVKYLDDVWSPVISDGEYIKVTFEQLLTSNHDITIYPRIVSGSPRIEVYETDGTEIIAEFTSINSNQYNKIFLDGSRGAGLGDRIQDTFDLRVLGGSIQVEHIIDPQLERFFEDCVDVSDWVTDGGATNQWIAGGGAQAGWCDASNTDAAANMTSVAIDLSASNILYANLSFNWSGSGFEAGEYLSAWVNSSATGTFQRIFHLATNTAGFADLNISKNITLGTGVFIRFTCNVNAANEHCQVDNINLTSFDTDTGSPKWADNATNGTSAGTFIEHSVNWTDVYELSGYILSFDNGTGSFANDSFVTFSGTQAWSNITKYVNETGGSIIRWFVWANDSSNNINSTATFQYTADAPPKWSQNSTNGTQAGTYIEHRVTWTDGIALSGYIFEFDNGTGSFTNDSFVTFTGTENFSNVTKYVNETVDSIIRWRIYGNDSANQLNSTPIFQYNTTAAGADAESPQFSTLTETPSDPATYSFGTTYEFNSTWTDGTAVDDVIIEFDGVNTTVALASGTAQNGVYRFTASLAAGTYNYYWWANDTLNNVNATSTQSYTVNQATPAGTITGTSSITYGTTGDVEGTESNDGDSDVTYILYRNGTAVSNPDTSILAANFYSYIYNTTGGTNYTSSASLDTFELTVNQATPVLDLQITNATYPNNGTINASETNSGDGDVTYSLYIDGILETTGSDIDISKSLAAGTYNITYNTTGGTNYTSGSNTTLLTISQGTPTGTIAGTSSITYPTAADVEGTEGNQGDGDVTYTLYRNGTAVSNPDTSVLAADFYSYIYNTTGGTNWTASSSLDTFDLTVNKGASVVNTFVNNTRANITIAQDSEIYLNVTTITGDSGATLRLYNDGTLINQGVSPLSNLTLFDTPGIFNITGFYIESENYTGSSEQWNVTVQAPDNPPQWFTPSTNVTNPDPNQIVNHQVNWTDNVELSWATLEVNGTGASCATTANVSSKLITGTMNLTNLSWVVENSCEGKAIGWRQYANDSANQWNVTDLQSYSVNNVDPVASFGTNQIDFYNSSSGTVFFELKGSDNLGVSFLRLYANFSGSWTFNQTNTTPVNDTIWNVTVAGISEGKYVWAAWVNDTSVNGNSDFTDTNRTLTVDLTAPTPTINAPANNTNTTDNTPDINITMTDNFDPEITYNIYVNDIVNKTGTLANNTATNVTLDQQPDGLKKIIAEATDDSGRKTNSSILFLTIDTIAPKWSSNTTNGTGAGTYLLHSVNWTDTQALSGYIFEFDNGTGFNNDSFVTFSGTQNFSNVTKYVNETVGTTIRWRVYANDSANNLNSTSIFTYTTTDITPPQWQNANVNVSNPDPNEIVNHQVNWTDNFALSYATLEVNGTGANCDTAQNVSSKLITGTMNLTNLSWVVNNACEGKAIGWRQYANDTDNNWNVTDLQSYSVNSVNPVASFGTNPVDKFNSSSSSVTFNIKGSDNLGISFLRLYANFSGSWTFNQTNTTPVNDTFWNFTVDGIPEGRYVWAAWVNDTSVNGNQDFTNTNRTLTVDLTNPTSTINQPANNTYTTDNTPDINVTVTDNFDASITTNIYLNGSLNKTQAVSNNTSTNITLSEALSDSLWLIIAEAVDDSGRRTNSSTLFLTVDTTNPLIEFVAPTSANGTSFSRTWIFANVTITEPNFQNVSFKLFNSTGLLNWTNFTDSTRSINWTGLSNDGVLYWYNVSSYDTLGQFNETETRYITLITDQPPVVTILYPQNTTYNVNVSELNYTATDESLSHCWYSLDGGTTNSTPDAACSNFTSLISNEDSNTWAVFANDSINQIGSDSVTFFKDTINPLIQFENPTEANNTNFSRTWIFVNVSITEANRNITKFDLYFSNFTLANSTQFTDSTNSLNFTGLIEGRFYYNVTVNDSAGNVNQTETRWITLDRTNPSVSYNPSTDAGGIFVNRNWIFINISATDINLDSVRMQWQGVNETLTTNDGSHYWENKTGLSDGNYSFFGWANDTSANVGATATRTIGVDTTPPSFTTIPANDTITYLVDWSGRDFDASDSGAGVDTFFINDTVNFTINSTGFLDNKTSLSAGSYAVGVSVNDSVGNTNNTIYILAINQNAEVLFTLFNTTSPVTYPDHFRVFSNASTSFTIYRNGTSVANNSEQNLSAGTYNFTTIRTDNVNYSDSYDEETFVVSKGTPTASLTNDQAWTREYDGTSNSIDISESNTGDSDLNYTLYRNDTFKVRPDLVSAIGAYAYKVNTTGGTNWTSNASMDTNTLTIIDTTKPLITVLYPTNTSYASAQTQLNYSASDLLLQFCWYSLNGGANSTPDATCSNFSGLTSNEGSNTWTVYVNDTSNNQNSSSVTFTVDTTAPTITLSTPANALNTSTTQQTFNATVFDGTNISFVRLYGNFSGTWGVNSTNTSGINNSQYKFTLGLPDGYYIWTYWANDSLGNSGFASTNRTLTVDTTNPSIFYDTNTDADNSFVNRNWVFVNITASDTNKDMVKLSFDGTNQSFTNNDGNLYWENKTSLSDGAHSFYAWVNDSANKVNSTATRTVTVDTTNPLIEFIAPTEANNTNFSRTWIFVNVSITEANFQNVTFTLFNTTGLVNQTTFTDSRREINFTSLPNGVYTYNVTTFDKANRTNNTETRLTRLDTAVPATTFVAPTEASGVKRSRNYIEINVTATDSLVGLDKIVIRLYNSTNQQINSSTNSTSPHFFNFTGLAEGLYLYNATANDTVGNANNTETRNITLDTTKPSITNIAESPADGVVYVSGVTYRFNATITDTNLDTVLIEFDGTNYTPSNTFGGGIYNFTITDLAAGVHNYYWWANDSAANVNTSVQTYTINNATGNITLLINGSAENQTAVYGTQTNASATTLFGSVTLFRNGTNVNSQNNAFVTLAAGFYNYTAVSTGDQNHSSASTSLFVTISKAASSVNLTLNGTDGNVTIVQDSEIYLNVTTITGDAGATLRLYNDGTLINEGTSPLSNLTAFGSVGVFNITGFYIDSENYTGSFETWYVNVTEAPDTTFPSVTSLTERPSDPANYSPGQVYEFNATATDARGISVVRIDFNGTNYSVINYSGNVYNFTISDLAVGTYNYRWYANDSAGNMNGTQNGTYTINQNTTNLTLTITPSTTVTYPTETTALGSNCPSQITCTLYRNGVDVGSSTDVKTLAIGTYNYTYNTTGNANYTADSETTNLTVNQNASACNVFFNATSPLTYPDAFTASTDCTSAFTLSRNGTTITNGSQQLLSASAYNFSVQRTDTENYTNTFDQEQFIISKATGIVFTYIDNLRANKTIDQFTEIYLNGTLETGIENIKLYNNGTLINEGTSPLSNLTNFSTLGLFNITTQYDGNENFTSAFETWYVNVTEGIDVTPPIFTIIPANDTIAYPTDWSGRDFDATDDRGFDSFSINDTARFTINSTGFLDNATSLAVGGYAINVTINDTSGNINWTIYVLTIDKGALTGTLASSHSGGFTYTYDGLATTISLSESNPGDSDVTYVIYRDGVSKGTGETVNLAAGSYNYTLNSTGGENWTLNTSIDTRLLTINQNAEVLFTLFNTTSPVTYPNTFRVFSNASTTFTIFRNGTSVSNNSEQALGAGTYNFTTIRTDSVNYSDSYDEETFVVSTAAPLGTISGTTPITYGTAADVQGNENNAGDSDVTYTLYRNGTLVSNPDVSVLGVSFYSYIFNTTGGTNYTSSASLDTFTLTVNKATGVVFTYIDNLRANKTIEQFTEIYLNGTLETGQAGGTIRLYNNGTLINEGTSPRSNLTNFSTIGLYNITTQYDGNENYTSAFETWYVNVSELDITPPQISILYPTNTSYNAVQTQLNYTATDDFALSACWYSLNLGATNVTVTCGTNVTGLNSGEGSSTWKVYANDTKGNENSSSVTFLVDTTNPTITFVSPAETNGTRLGRNFIQVNVTATDTNFNTITVRLYNSTNHQIRINTSTENPSFINYTGLTEGNYSFNATANDSIGNTANTETRTVSLERPGLAILRPENETYFNNISLHLNFSVELQDEIRYNIDNTTNTTITGNTTFNTTTGLHTLYLFANNTLGTTSKNVTFTINISTFKVIYDNYKNNGSTTEFNASSFEDIQNLSGVVLERTSDGKISFNEAINLTNDSTPGDNVLDLDSNTNLSFNSIFLNSTALPNFNTSATLSLYGLTFTDPRVLRNGEVCPSTICTEVGYSSGTFIFNVTQFTNYSAEETPSTAAPPAEGGGPSTGGGLRQCTNDNDCKVDENCINSRCVKLFDIKIIDFQSPARLGEFFEFTYFVKALANINNDVVIGFWIEDQTGERISSGSDTIYLGSYEEKTEKTKIFLPSSFESGIYNFVAEVSFEGSSARSQRTIEVDVKEGIIIISPIDSRGVKTLVIAFLIVLALIALVIVIYKERKKIKKNLEFGFAQEARFVKRYQASILTFLLIVIAGLLFYLLGFYEFLVLNLSEAILWFKIYSKYVYYVLLGLILIIALGIIAKSKGARGKFHDFHEWRRKRRIEKFFRRKYREGVREAKEGFSGIMEISEKKVPLKSRLFSKIPFFSQELEKDTSEISEDAKAIGRGLSGDVRKLGRGVAYDMEEMKKKTHGAIKASEKDVFGFFSAFGNEIKKVSGKIKGLFLRIMEIPEKKVPLKSRLFSKAPYFSGELEKDASEMTEGARVIGEIPKGVSKDISGFFSAFGNEIKKVAGKIRRLFRRDIRKIKETPVELKRKEHSFVLKEKRKIEEGTIGPIEKIRRLFRKKVKKAEEIPGKLKRKEHFFVLKEKRKIEGEAENVLKMGRKTGRTIGDIYSDVASFPSKAFGEIRRLFRRDKRKMQRKVGGAEHLILKEKRRIKTKAKNLRHEIKGFFKKKKRFFIKKPMEGMKKTESFALKEKEKIEREKAHLVRKTERSIHKTYANVAGALNSVLKKGENEEANPKDFKKYFVKEDKRMLKKPFGKKRAKPRRKIMGKTEKKTKIIGKIDTKKEPDEILDKMEAGKKNGG